MRHTRDRLEEARAVIDHYCRAHDLTEYTLDEVASWAALSGDLTITRDDRHKFLCELLGQASRDHVITDGLGRRVRLRYSARMEVQNDDGGPVQRMLWAHIDDASDVFMVAALSQMSEGIVADVKSYFACLDYYNARRAGRGLEPYQPDLPFGRPSEEG